MSEILYLVGLDEGRRFQSLFMRPPSFSDNLFRFSTRDGVLEISVSSCIISLRFNDGRFLVARHVIPFLFKDRLLEVSFHCWE